MNKLKILSAVLIVAVFVAACQPQAANTATTSTTTTSSAALTTTSSPSSASGVASPTYPAPASSSASSAASTTSVAPAAGTASASTASAMSLRVSDDPKLGQIITDSKGMTLYMYTKDQPDTSNCYDQCAAAWPPLLTSAGQPVPAAAMTGKLGSTARKDGSMQVTYNGMPLYYWAKDAKPGDTTGQNVGGVWFVVPPTTAGFPTVKTATPADKSLGVILTDLKGMTLYRWTKDTANTSNCYDQCAANWPPLLVSSGDLVLAGGVQGKLATLTRTDGKTQVTYDGQPLYYYVKDTKAGETNGQNVGGNWFVVNPKAP